VRIVVPRHVRCGYDHFCTNDRDAPAPAAYRTRSRAIYCGLHSTLMELRYDQMAYTTSNLRRVCGVHARNRCSRGRISMPLPASSRAQFTADLTICRILNGMWQVSGAHGAIDPVRAVDAMSAYHEAVLPLGTWPTITARPRISSATSAGDSPHVMEWTGFQRFRRLRSGCRARAG
jgi:hypothetical protein